MKTPRNGKIDLLKFIFAIAIAFYHFEMNMQMKNCHVPNAYFGVEFFFIVSGYFMAKSLCKYDGCKDTDIIKTSLSYVKHKYLGFFKYHVFAFMLMVIAWKPILKFSYKRWLLEAVAAVPNFFLLGMFNCLHPAWLIVEWYLSSMMIVIFILTPIMIKYRKIYSCYIAPILSFFLLCFVFRTCHKLETFFVTDHTILMCNLRAFSEISFGCILFEITEHKALEKFPKWLLVAAEIGCYLIVFAYIAHDFTSKIEITIFMFLLLGIAISFTKKSKLKFLNNKAVYFLGKLSLSIYLCHTVVYKAMGQNAVKDMGYLSAAAIYFSIVIAVSCVCMFTADYVSTLISKQIQKFQKTT